MRVRPRLQLVRGEPMTVAYSTSNVKPPLSVATVKHIDQDELARSGL